MINLLLCLVIVALFYVNEKYFKDINHQITDISLLLLAFCLIVNLHFITILTAAAITTIYIVYRNVFKEPLYSPVAVYSFYALAQIATLVALLNYALLF